MPKSQAWLSSVQNTQYNAHEECTTNRTVKQLSEKWDTLKTKAKGALAHKELSKTGHGWGCAQPRP